MITQKHQMKDGKRRTRNKDVKVRKMMMDAVEYVYSLLYILIIYSIYMY